MAESPTSLADTIARARIVVCTGTGGVGKTTTAAAIGLAAARAGRRAMVVTIDPARRLAQALGLASLDNDARLVEGAGRNGGSLHAAMLDPRATFDAMVTRCAHDDAQRDRILGNRFYQNIAGNLSGTHEYMAMEKLYDLANTEAYDLIVVDTPPTRDALAFLDAPRLFARLLDNWLYKITSRRAVASPAPLPQAHTRSLANSPVSWARPSSTTPLRSSARSTASKRTSAIERMRSSARSNPLTARSCWSFHRDPTPSPRRRGSSWRSSPRAWPCAP